MKKMWALLLCVALGAGLLSGCGKNEDGTTDSQAQPQATPQPINVFDYNPLTGLSKDKNVPDGQRPVAVMVDNLRDAWPQAGISQADVIYEMVTEGGITRLMAVYTDYRAIANVGPVRSARDQFVQFAMPMNAMLVHIGSSSYANDLLNYYRYQDIDGYYLGTNAFSFDSARNQTRDKEHCWFTNGSLIQAGIDKVGTLQTTGTLNPLFSFAQSPVSGTAAANQIAFRFSQYADAAFAYDPASGNYLQSQFGVPHTDGVDGSQLSFKNVMVLVSNITLKKDGVVTEFDLSKGDGWYFTGGTLQKITWQKGEPDAAPAFFDAAGKALAVNPGKSYIAVISKEAAATLTVDGAAPA